MTVSVPAKIAIECDMKVRAKVDGSDVDVRDLHFDLSWFESLGGTE